MEPTAVIALKFADGSVSRMQFYAEPTDDAIVEAIDTTNFPAGKPVSWERKDGAWSSMFSAKTESGQ